jgi:hypothetical protein
MPTAKHPKLKLKVSASRLSTILRDKHLEELGVTKETDSLYGAMIRVGHDDYFEPSKLPMSTSAKAGTLEKVLVLAARVVAGEALWVVGDNVDSATVEERHICVEAVNRMREEDIAEKLAAKHRAIAEMERIERNAKAKQVREQKNGGKQKPIRISKEVLKAWKQQ